MEAVASALPGPFTGELKSLFQQRTRICLWLGVIFFSLFSLLDLICHREYFLLFLFYRLSFVLILLVLLNLLRFQGMRPYAAPMMFAAMLLGTLTISLMTLKLGGFASGYYVGILLMIAGGFSVLPLSVAQASTLGGSMYLVYGVTILIGSGPLGDGDVIYVVNNSFFFFSIVAVTTVQCFDDIQTQLSALRAKKNLRNLHDELRHYTGNLEALVKKRLESLEESELRFTDLYHNILDLVMLIDRDGQIVMVNLHGAAILERTAEELQGRMLGDFMTPRDRDQLFSEVIPLLASGRNAGGIQMQMLTYRGTTIEVELSGNRVDLPDRGDLFQLIIRDITATKEMEQRLLESSQLIDSSRQAAIFGLARLAECRHDDTGAHLVRIREYTRLLATELASNPDLHQIITPTYIDDLCLSSVLHDIGKVGIPDAILLKPGKLSAEEYDAMKRHCEYGSIALSSAEKASESLTFLRMGQDISSYHHERWDGTGYPRGLAGTDIPLSARIVALADVYDALTSSRIYKPAYNHEQARRVIIEDSGRRFDPTIVNAFLRRESDFKAARMQLLLQASRSAS
jgi:PAS domain S-box-containing protein